MSARPSWAIRSATTLLVIAPATVACGQAAPPAPAQPAVTQPAMPDVSDDSDALGWPRHFEEAGRSLTLYQPQVDSWKDNQLTARAAIAVKMASSAKAGEKPQEEFGIVWLSARTEVDKVTKLVALNDIKVTKIAFPQHRDQEALVRDIVNAKLPDMVADVPLDHLEANLAITQNADASSSTVVVKNDVPDIQFSTDPALLVLIDGDPAMRPIEGTKLMRVVNTRALILLDGGTNTYYLHAMNGWYSAPAAAGPWTRATGFVPSQIQASAAPLAKTGAVDLLDPQVPEAAPKEPPKVIVSTKPAELLQTVGDPQYTPIAGTNLLYVKNTDDAMFMDVTSQQQYVLISGRWFKAASLQGPWTFVDAKALPADFAKIPADSPKANVLVSIPGTEQAKQAVVASQIPQTATVKIADAKLDVVTYDGTPKFQEIAGATGLAYAVNSPQPVVRVDADQTFWSVSNGVWFTARSPMGTWAVATVVPPIIYTIPISCPIHYVTYVRIYGATPQVVYVGYTPGYMGAYVAPEGVVVYGSGYYYPAYVGTVWYGYPCTYGYGAGFACGAFTGFAFGFAAGAILGDCWCQPHWGPCWGYAHVDINTSSVYANWRGGVTYANRHYEYNGATGQSWSQGRAGTFNPYTGRASAGGYSNYYDRASGDFDLKRGGATYNSNTGVVKAGGREISGNVYDGNANVDRGGARINTRTDTGIAYKDGDVYAGHDGNVYRHTDDGWEHHTDNGWQDVQRNQNLAGQTRDLDRQRQSRNVGQQQFDSFRGSGQSYSGGANVRSSGGGGGNIRSSGGGGGGTRGGGGGGLRRR